ncbi:HWE histidine kinase domain-containing protein, partial [Streptococcus suis]
HGRLVALIFLHDRNVRHWSDDKLAFLQEALRRTREAIERRRAEDARELLTGELHHRVKNMLAVVQAIATQTFQGEGVEDALDTFHARLTALGA